MITSFDHVVLEALNGQVGRFEGFDKALFHIAGNALFKGVPVMMLVWGLWMRPGSDAERERSRVQLLALLCIGIIAVGLGRALALLLPFRPRPLHTDSVDVKLASVVDPGTLGGWSAFPSDHAVLFFALAAGLFIISRKAGALAAAHALFFVTIPRAYFGLHWATDIVAGLVIGILLAAVAMRPLSIAFSRTGAAEAIERHAMIAYPLLFLVTFQIATLFNSVRWFLESVAGMLST